MSGLANGHGDRKVCALCKEPLPLSDFGTHLRPERIPGKRYVNSYCRPCSRKKWDKAQTRDSRLRRLYGMSSNEFDERLTLQGGCAACGSTTTDGKYWHVDHDHSCCSGRRSCGKCVRGILCHGCNTALGNVRDDVERLHLLISYLGRVAV